MRPTWLLAATGFLSALGIAVLWSCASPTDYQRSSATAGDPPHRRPRGSHGKNAFPAAKAPQETEGCSHCGGEGQGKAPDPSYPLKTCVVSGNVLGSMGDPVEVDHQGTKVLLCCQGCVETFQADPEKYVASLRSAGATGKGSPER